MYRDGDRMLVPCEGGPCTSRLVLFPPPVEIAEGAGAYVLEGDGTDDGPVPRSKGRSGPGYRYVYVDERM